MTAARTRAVRAGAVRLRSALSIRIELDEARLGPGKIELLSHIEREQSLAAAARTMGMSYRRAWELLAALNAMFSTPVATTLPGRNRAGATTLTATGQRVIALYRQVEKSAQRASAADLRELLSLRAKPAAASGSRPQAKRASRTSSAPRDTREQARHDPRGAGATKPKRARA